MRSSLARNAIGRLALAGAFVASAAQAQYVAGPPVNPAPMARTLVARNAVVAALATAPKAALVQDVSNEAYAPYKEGVFAGCTLAGVCTVSFSAVPAGHRRIVEHLSCSIYVATTGALRYVAFLANSYTAPRDFYPYSRSPADAGQYVLNAATQFPFEAGETPLVYAYADTAPVQDLTCTATGREIVLP